MKKTVKILSIAFILIGVLGFIEALAPEGKLLGIFEVDTMHNIVHILTGIVGLIAARTACGAKKFSIIFGIVYLAVAILGFVNGGHVFIFHANGADNILHTVLAIVFLAIGMGKCSKHGMCSGDTCTMEGKCCKDGTCSMCADTEDSMPMEESMEQPMAEMNEASDSEEMMSDESQENMM